MSDVFEWRLIRTGGNTLRNGFLLSGFGWVVRVGGTSRGVGWVGGWGEVYFVKD